MSVEKPCVLLVEDEPAQREVIRYNLVSEGCEVVMADNGDDALHLFDEVFPDLVLLDWMLPRKSGLEVCRSIKSRKDARSVPILMVSARSEELDAVRGLETGADDYVTKPFSMKELMARVRTHLRKSHPIGVGETLEHGGIVLDSAAFRATRDGNEVKLGPTEFRLLGTLLEKPNRVWSREQLLDRAWGRDIYVETRTVDVHIGRLRKALHIPGKPDPVRTVRGIGYSLS